MALIKCKECGHEVSEKASVCPNCGCPMEKGLICSECGIVLSAIDNVCPNCGNPIYTLGKKKSTSYLKIALLGVLAVALFGTTFCVWNYLNEQPNGNTAAESITVPNNEGTLAEKQTQEERIREEEARQDYIKREQQKAQHKAQQENERKSSQNSSNNNYSQYSTDKGRMAYMEVLQLQKEVRALIDRSAPYRRIMQSEVYGSYNYQVASIQNRNILNAAIEKQERAVSIARNKLHDESLIRELNGQLKLLNKAKYSD